MQEYENLPWKRDIEIILNKIKHSKLLICEKTLNNNVSWEQYKLKKLTQKIKLKETRGTNITEKLKPQTNICYWPENWWKK